MEDPDGVRLLQAVYPNGSKTTVLVVATAVSRQTDDEGDQFTEITYKNASGTGPENT